MFMFDSEFDDDRPWDDGPTLDCDAAEWGESTDVDQELLEEPPEWDEIVPDLEAEYGDLYRGAFGSAGRDADAGYTVDAECDPSMLL